MASGASPPKPWERAAAAASSGGVLPTSASTATAAVPTAAGAAPALPARPDALNAVATRAASQYSSPYNRTTPYSSPYGMGGFGGMGGMSGMSGMGGMSSYSSPYSRFGGGMYGSSMYGGGGYGMGGGYGGYGQPGMYGPNGAQDPQSLTQSFSNSTQATFQMIESIVGAFGGFAQMLESTYMATHSSFFAMVSVAEQFGNLKSTLGSVLGIFALMRWLRRAVAKLTGRPPPADSKELTVANFAAFSGRPGAPDAGAQPKPSRKPFIFFVIAVFGLPYLMGKLIRSLAASQEEQARHLAAANPELANAPIDPSKLDFCRVLYDYTPQSQPGQPFQDGIDLVVKKGDLVAVLSKSDPMGQPSEWWRCRARDGGVGYLPSPYLETIQRRPAQAQLMAKSAPVSEAGSRLNTLTTLPESRANSMKITEREKELVKAAPKSKPQMPEGKPGDISVESFQRAAFQST